jgi:hexosaminidase
MSYFLTIDVEKPELKSVFTTKEEFYTLNISDKSASLKTETFVGMVRGLETFLQSFECPRYKFKNCIQRNLPIEIVDEPAFVYRGLMVDTSRHFLPMHLLY